MKTQVKSCNGDSITSLRLPDSLGVEIGYQWGGAGDDKWESASESTYKHWLKSDSNLCRQVACIVQKPVEKFECEPIKEESQEEMIGEIFRDYKEWFTDPDTGMTDYLTMQNTLLAKFTITRR